jgi:hypothetical protein
MISNKKKSDNRVRTSELLADIAAETSSDQVLLGEIIDRFGVRAFGLLLLFCALVGVIPAPAGPGALSGGLLIAVAVQLLFAKKHPWLPLWLRKRGIPRSSITAFLKRFGPWLQKTERLCKPRALAAFQPHWIVLMGLLLIGHGVVLMLPIPATNIPLAFVVILAGIALIEDDGIAWMISGLFMLSGIIGTFFLADALISVINNLITKIFG